MPLDAELLTVVDRYRTCEFATLSKTGVPMAWPAVVLRRPDGTFLITTSIALPQKAYNVRRDPRVALLFSEPTASGLEGAPQVLVQGTATCPDEIVTDVRSNEEYWRRLHERQPSNRRYSADPLSRRLLDWYFMRLLITVTPTAVSTRAPLPPGPAPSTGGAVDGVAGDALQGLAAFPSAVLGTRDADGMPRLARVRATGPADGAALALDAHGADGLRPGPASLLAHSHDEELSSQRSVAVLGELSGPGTGWTFAPQRVIPGMGDTSPLTMFRTVRDLRRTARGYLERRSLTRPEIPWSDVRQLKA
jgi:Pyridoxamine 5'-phosphate oxidase